MHKLAYSIRNKLYILENTQPKQFEYIPQIYIKLKNWNPPPATNLIEDQSTQFGKLMEEALKAHKENPKRIPYNLTPNQNTTLRNLITSKDFVILPMDKNLGPAIINRTDYIKQVINQHLFTLAYEQLNLTATKNKLQDTRNLLIHLLYNTHNTHSVKQKFNNIVHPYFTADPKSSKGL
jgi:hypothetical protein